MIIAADLDGTLSDSKQTIKPDMAEVMADWLKTERFAVISGAAFHQFEKQLLAGLPPETNLANLFLFPTNGAVCLSFVDGKWKEIYKNAITEDEKELIFKSINEALEESGIKVDTIYGEQTEFRGGQVTFSALGQEAPLSEKAPWDPDQVKRKRIVEFLAPRLQNFTVTIGGATSIDVTRKGIDKKFAIRKIEEILGVTADEITFLGDAIFPGGNDWPAAQEVKNYVKVSGPEESMEKIKDLTSLLQR